MNSQVTLCILSKANKIPTTSTTTIIILYKLYKILIPYAMRTDIWKALRLDTSATI